MKTKFIIISSIGLLLGLSISSCSRCYKCKTQYVYEVNGVPDTSEVEEDYCTANAQELKDKEKNGYKCSPS